MRKLSKIRRFLTCQQLAQERMRPHANVDLIYDCQIHILYKLSNSDLKNLLVEAIGHKDQHTIDLVGKFLILLRKKSDVLRADNKK